MNTNTCRICGKENNSEEYILKEMMFGTREEFEYYKCSECGCLQIKEFPKNIQDYYPSNYLPESEYSTLKKYLRRKREISVLSGNGILGKILTNLFGYPLEYSWFTETNIKKTNSILEVGCGKGDLLKLFFDAGFKDLMGIDPFLEKDFTYNNLKILKKDLSQINDVFDLVMFHHSFEHLNNPHETFNMLKNIVKRKGEIIIRIPLIDSFAWETYKTNWVQLDPPRHFFLHTVKSIKYLCDIYGFHIRKILYDSNSIQFWGSEQYRRQIPLMDSNSLLLKYNNSIFRKEELKQYEQKAVELNNNKQGDMASFYLGVL